MGGDLVVGLFVGGSGRRMGGVSKGLLTSPSGETLIDRLHRVARDAVPQCSVVLVGRAQAYAALGLPEVPDAPGGVGPIGGLRALLQHATAAKARAVVALSCDLPWIETGLIERLASEAPEAWIVAPREDGVWSPLTARYSVAVLAHVEASIHAGRHSLQHVFTAVGDGAVTLGISAAEREQLVDWDSPEDISSR